MRTISEDTDYQNAREYLIQQYTAGKDCTRAHEHLREVIHRYAGSNLVSAIEEDGE